MAGKAQYPPADYGVTVGYPSVEPPGAPLLQAPAQGPMSRDGLTVLENSNGVMIRQKLQLLEEFLECCERRNKYKISPLPPEFMARPPTDIEFKAMPSLMEVREQSTFCCRYCCANQREMTLGFFPGDTPEAPHWPVEEPLFKIFRPFRCTVCCICCLLNPQEFQVISHGRDVGKIVEECRFCDCCFKCTCWAKGLDAAGNHVYSFKTPMCGTNCCAPTCCNVTFTISVVDAKNEHNVLSTMKNIWPGCNFRGLCSANADNYVVEFPNGATKEQKALIMGALFYHDFLFFEKTNNDNN